MFRHQRRKTLIEDLIPSGEEPWVYEADEIVSFVEEKQTVEGRDSIDNVHAPTDLTYLVTNDYDVDVSVQPLGGIYHNVDDNWEVQVAVGDPVVIPAGESGYVGVFPDSPYMQDYTVELTWESLGQGEEGATVIAIWAVDQ